MHLTCLGTFRFYRFECPRLAVIVITLVVADVPVMIPTMVVLEAAAITVPVAVVVAATFPTRANPSRACIRGTRPIAAMPAVVAAIGIPVAVDPIKIGPRGYRPMDNTGRRWGTNFDSYSYLSGEYWSAGHQHAAKQQRADKLFHVSISSRLRYLYNTCVQKYSRGCFLIVRRKRYFGEIRLGERSELLNQENTVALKFMLWRQVAR